MLAFRTLPFLCAALTVLPAWAQQPATPAPVPSVSRSAAAASPLELLHQLDEGYTQLYNQVVPSVVIIDTNKRAPGDSDDSHGFDFFFRAPEDNNRRRFKMPERPSSEGSGFFVRQNGYIITNNHVIEGAEKITVKLKDGRQFPAKVIGADDRSDIAVIKIETTGAPVVEFANSDAVRIGQRVCAIGVPFALEFSFTIGCVSGKGRGGFTNLTYEDYLQTDAFINPGNSGGPLFDVDGRVVGMNTLINGIGRGLAFAIPSNMLRDVSDQLITKGRISRPWLGIRIETLGEDSSLREQIQGVDKGVVINTIEPETPAYKSDLRPADVIVALDGQPVNSARDLQKLVLTKKVGQTVTLSVWRNGKTLKIPVTTGELPVSGDAGRGANPRDEREEQSSPEPSSAYGFRMEDLTKETADRLGSRQSVGVVVTDVAQGSPAAISGIQTNDVVTEIDSKPVTNAASARKLLREHDGKKALLLFLERKGQKTYAVLKIEK